ncbi:hypothetical protein PROFUN_11648 [Planoprotostelium fungivorum]|uniref:Uncharacterized protein n=1 Tax=Planoprotostelium fungivorum TaxID=1890364 RepID=A0A2P6N9S7_9EUKA|nr:hypothetical protein PROFUN_11648 [Planoprotostelium fungivorum]
MMIRSGSSSWCLPPNWVTPAVLYDISVLRSYQEVRKPQPQDECVLGFLLYLKHHQKDRDGHTREDMSRATPIAIKAVRMKLTAGPHARYTPKHVRNAHKLEKSRQKKAIYCMVDRFFHANDTVRHDLVRDYFSCIKDLVKLMGYRYKKHLLLPTIIYMDRYIRKTGPIVPADFFRLLLTSAIVTVKFWEDWGVDADLVQEVCGLSRKDIGNMERNFLSTIDYSLFLTPQEVDTALLVVAGAA